MAGFQNAAALLLLLVQTGTLLGFAHQVPFSAAASHLGEAHPLSLMVAALTIFVTIKAKRWLPRVPAILVGLAIGTLAYYALVGAGFAQSLKKGEQFMVKI